MFHLMVAAQRLGVPGRQIVGLLSKAAARRPQTRSVFDFAVGLLYRHPHSMTEFLATLNSQALLTDGAMGSYLFELTGRLSETNRVYELFNVEQPELIRKVHLAYLAAGARCLKTNTFGANRQQLRPLGLEDRVADLNRGGVQRAREAIAKFQAQRGEPGPFFVLASVGPTVKPLTTADAVAECYREQIETLAAASADALLFETFNSLPQLELLIGLIRSLPQRPPVIAELCRKLCRQRLTTKFPTKERIQRDLESLVSPLPMRCFTEVCASAVDGAQNPAHLIAHRGVRLVGHRP